MDLAVELPLPDANERLELLKLYAENIDHEVQDWGPAVERTAGTPASFIAELLRSAALLAAQRQSERVDAHDIDAALTELLDSGPPTASLLGARWNPDHDDEPSGSAAFMVGPRHVRMGGVGQIQILRGD